MILAVNKSSDTVPLISQRMRGLFVPLILIFSHSAPLNQKLFW